MTPAHNPMLGDGFAPPHMPVIPMQYPDEIARAGMQLGQGTVNPRIHQARLSSLVSDERHVPTLLTDFGILASEHAAAYDACWSAATVVEPIPGPDGCTIL